MLIYILKFSACLAVLLIFYKLFLERESIHVFKRFYLLCILAFSLVVPALVFTEYVVASPSPAAQPVTTYSNETINIPPALEADVLDMAPLLWGFYFIGLIFFGIKFMKNLFQIFRRIRNNPKERAVPFVRVLLLENFPPHTFFKYIFLNKAKLESNEIPEEVLVHEETHARQKHSLDVLFVELLQIVMWFNPLIYFMRKSIKLNHEFLADKEVLKKGLASSTYQNTLLSFMTPIHHRSLANAINYSSIKKRFAVMKKRTSKKSVFLRSLLLVPLLATLFFSFTQKKVLEIYPKNNLEIAGEWIDEEHELTVLSIDKINDDLMSGNVGSEIFRFVESNGKYFYFTLFDSTRHPVILNNKTGELTLADKKFIRKGKTLREKLVGDWENNDEGVKFIVRFNGNEILWDIIKMDGKPVRYYPKKRGDRYAFTYGEELELWSFKVEDGVLYDSNGVAYQRIVEAVEQKGATKDQISEYYALVNKYEDMNGTPRMKKSDLERLKYLHRLVNPQRLKYLSFFHEYSDPGQEGATKEQLAEYNALAAKYNAMMQQDDIRIEMSEVERLEYLHSLMTEQQREEAEPFPDFPEPPEPPALPTPPNQAIEIEEEIEEGVEDEENVIQEIIANQEVYDELSVDKKIAKAIIDKKESVAVRERNEQFLAPTPPNINQVEQRDGNWTVTSSANRNMQQSENEIPLPPTTPTIATLANTDDYSQELKTAIKKYLEKNKTFEESVLAYTKEQKGSVQDLWNMYNEAMELYVNYHVIAKKEGNFVQPIPAYKERKELKNRNPGSPPPLPEPKSPIEHLKELNGQGALFYHGKKKITYDEAIALLKKNDDLSVDIKRENDKLPVVKISRYLD